MFSEVFSKIESKFEYVQLAMLGLVAGGGLIGAAIVTAGKLQGTLILMLIDIDVNHNETLVADEGREG